MTITLAATAASALAFALYTRVVWPFVLLGWVGLAPWLAALGGARTLRGALAIGWLFSVAFVLAVFSWFATGIAAYTGIPLPIAFALLVLGAPLLQPQLLVYAGARFLAAGRRPGAVTPAAALAAALLYVGAEWALPKLLGDSIGHGLFASPRIRQAADLAGAPGLTLALLLVNECALAMGQSLASAPGSLRARLARLRAPAACAAAILLALTGYGTLRLAQLAGQIPARPLLTAGVVQADISRYGELARELGTYDAAQGILAAHFDLSRQALAQGGVDLLVWAETVYPATFGTPKTDAGASLDREIAAFVADSRVPLVFGAYDVDAKGEFNAAVFLEPGRGGRFEFETYRKSWLFPLTERVPRWLDGERVRGWLPWLGTWQPGSGAQVLPLTLPDGRRLEIAPLICYDATTPGLAIAAVRAGAELLVTLSNDAWFASGEGPHLHLVVSAFRSLETRRSQVRATNTGISAVISPTGELLAAAGVHERAAIAAGVPAAPASGTLMLAWGDWFGPFALGVGLVLLGAIRWMRTK
ncbi:MAG TPA: apolipoprotein N-acyltransferase [Myxococcota bacterium]